MTTQSAVFSPFTLTTPSREPGRYGSPVRLAMTPSNPATSSRSSQPSATLRSRGRGRDRERELLDAFAPLLERKLVDRLAVPEEEVERDEVRGDLRRELAHAALCGMEAHLQRVEVERSVTLDDDLAVDRRVRLQLLPERLELREIAEEGTAVTAPEMQLARHVLEDPAEAVPLRLVLPAVRLGQLVDELGLHRRKRKLGRNRRGHCAV